MLQAVGRFLRRRFDVAQLNIDFPDAASKKDVIPAKPDVIPNAHERHAPAAAALHYRLKALGLRRIATVTLTKNRHVMASYRGDALRIHAAFTDAPDATLTAVVAFIEGRTRADRKAAQRVITGYPIAGGEAPLRREQTHPADVVLAAQMTEWHERYNAQYFDGMLKQIDVRVSRRMKSRLGHYSPARGEVCAEIAVSRSHIKRHGLSEALHTLRHEMVHQWQDETTGVVDHGTAFRRKAREVGVAPSARRVV